MLQSLFGSTHISMLPLDVEGEGRVGKSITKSVTCRSDSGSCVPSRLHLRQFSTLHCMASTKCFTSFPFAPSWHRRFPSKLMVFHKGSHTIWRNVACPSMNFGSVVLIQPGEMGKLHITSRSPCAKNSFPIRMLHGTWISHEFAECPRSAAFMHIFAEASLFDSERLASTKLGCFNRRL